MSSGHGYLATGIKSECYGCEACTQACRFGAMEMREDDEGFRYPVVDASKCAGCNACNRACPCENEPARHGDPVVVFGGHVNDSCTLEESTSGGAFSAIVRGWFESGGRRAAAGAVAHGLEVNHEFAFSFNESARFRKSKYAQSSIGRSFETAFELLKGGTDVLFSGTPCQIAGLLAFLGKRRYPGTLLTVEVICEGVPSPLYVRSLDEKMAAEHGSRIRDLDYRCKDGRKWDFQVMSASLENGHHFKMDRWFNPFWSIWLDHLMSRPSCYGCPFATRERVADISLGDLWGVHLYCPDLYNKNGGASLVFCNSDLGTVALGDALPYLEGRELRFEDALRYQSPMRKSISMNPKRHEFFEDLKSLSYDELNGKWASAPSAKLLWQKYVWGNRQKVAAWNVKRSLLKLFNLSRLGE